MKKKYAVAIIFIFFVVLFIVLVCKEKAQIKECEEIVLEATEKAITALENYRNDNDFDELQKVIKELEVCNKYMREIEDISEEEIGCWDISMAVCQLTSFDSDDEIKALDYLELGLEHMKENIYSVGAGYFISFINLNSVDE